MEDLAKPVALNHEMVETLDQIRAGAENALYGASPAQAEELFKKHLAPMVVGSGMPVLQVMHYQWFLRELARLWRTRKGRDLAFHLELTIRKWVNLGLEPRTIQFLICEAHQRLKANGASTVNREPHTVPDAGPAIENRQSSIENRMAPDPQPPIPDNETAKTPSHQGGDMTTEPRSISQTPSAESAKSADVRSGAEQSVESVKSVDVRSGRDPSSASGRHSVSSAESVDVRSLETAKDAKIAKTEPESTTKAPSHQGSEHSIPRSLDPSIPCSSHSIPRSLDPSIPCSSHSIPRSLGPSIPEELS